MKTYDDGEIDSDSTDIDWDHVEKLQKEYDKLKQEGLLKHFSKVMLWHGFKEENFTAVHIPLMLSSLRDGKFCVHGHTHKNKLTDPHYINVCVEVRNYTPVHIDEIIQEIKDVS